MPFLFFPMGQENSVCHLRKLACRSFPCPSVPVPVTYKVTEMLIALRETKNTYT